MAPIIAEETAKIDVNCLLNDDINIKGASFCHVIKIKQLVHDNPWTVAGNQKCIGAAPIFNPKAITNEYILSILAIFL